MLKFKMFIAGVFLAFGLNVAVFAGVDADDVTVMPVHNTSKFFVSFADDVAPQQVTIAIQTLDGDVIYVDKLETNKVTKVYDMSEYGKDIYQVVISGTDFSLTKKVELGKAQGFDAKLVKDNDRIELIYLSQDAELDISIEDQNGNILYKGNGTFGKYQQAFDISKLPAGKYTLKVTNGEQVFEENFEVKY